MAHQRLQHADFFERRRPDVRRLGSAQVGDERGIQFIGLVASQLARGVAFDARRIDHAHSKARHIQIRATPSEERPVASRQTALPAAWRLVKKRFN